MKVSYWLAVTAAIALISYFYHPTVPTMVGGALIGLALTILIVWSSSRIPSGKTWIAKVLAVSLMAGLMNVTALDVLYSLLAAPEGNRYILPIEMAVSGLMLALFGGVRPLFRSNPKEQ